MFMPVPIELILVCKLNFYAIFNPYEPSVLLCAKSKQSQFDKRLKIACLIKVLADVYVILY